MNIENTFAGSLRQALESDALIGVFSDPADPAAFMVGWVEAVTDEHVLLRHLSTHGRYDGYRLLAIDDIFRLDTAGRYLERLRLLSQVREERFVRFFKAKMSREADLVTETLLAAQQHELLVRVYILDGDHESGWVKDLTHDTVTITRLDEYGIADFEATVHLEAISEVHCDDEGLQDLQILARRETEPPNWLKN
jgi:hypothetical protein